MCLASRRISAGWRTAASRAATSRATTAVLRTASMPCSSNSPSATTWTRTASSGTRRAQRGCCRRCAPSSAPPSVRRVVLQQESLHAAVGLFLVLVLVEAVAFVGLDQRLEGLAGPRQGAFGDRELVEG